MMRDNLVGLIEPMVYRAGVHSLAGHHQARQTGGCSRSTELAIVALKRSWRQIFRWKTGRRAENSNWPAWEMTTAAHASRAVGTACHQSHRTIDPQCLTKSPPRRGGIFALTKNVASPVHAEPAHRAHCNKSAEHLPLPSGNDAYESLHMLTVLPTLAPIRIDAPRCTVASRSSANLSVAGFIVRVLHNRSLPSRYDS